jgi:predicted nucleotidyltransferase
MDTLVKESNGLPGLTAPQHELLLANLRRYLPGVPVWAYGSRVKGTARPYSDIDLAVFAPRGKRGAVSELSDALDESDLPFAADIQLWDELPEAFHSEIERRHQVLQ